MDGKILKNVTQLRSRQPENEKITINLGFVDLGRIDLLVQEGFYSNRTDLIRTAIRNQLDTHTEVVSKKLDRHAVELGLRDYSVTELESVRDAGEVLHIKVVELALQTIGSITVLGALQASADVKKALADRIS